MSHRPNTPQRDRPTEYRLSLSSNPSSRRSSLGTSQRDQQASNQTMIDKYVFPQLRELSDSIVTLDSNMTHMNFIHESITDLNESLSALLYGLMCNSWCVDFPKISHDTAHELKLVQKLEELKQEKVRLLAKLKPEDASSKSAVPSSIQSISKRGSQLPTSSLNTNRNTNTMMLKNNEDGRPTNQKGSHDENDDNNDDDDDDDNTAASFVSNPTTFRSQIPNPTSSTSSSVPHRPMFNEKPNQTSSRIRRQSILHQIRNSTGPSINNAASTNPNSNTQRKRSLAVSAKRIPSQAGPSASAIISTNNNTKSNTGNNQKNGISISGPGNRFRTPRPRQRTYQSKDLSSRPPFR